MHQVHFGHHPVHDPDLLERFPRDAIAEALIKPDRTIARMQEDFVEPFFSRALLEPANEESPDPPPLKGLRHGHLKEPPPFLPLRKKEDAADDRAVVERHQMPALFFKREEYLLTGHAERFAQYAIPQFNFSGIFGILCGDEAKVHAEGLTCLGEGFHPFFASLALILQRAIELLISGRLLAYDEAFVAPQNRCDLRTYLLHLAIAPRPADGIGHLLLKAFDLLESILRPLALGERGAQIRHQSVGYLFPLVFHIEEKAQGADEEKKESKFTHDIIVTRERKKSKGIGTLYFRHGICYTSFMRWHSSLAIVLLLVGMGASPALAEPSCVVAFERQHAAWKFDSAMAGCFVAAGAEESPAESHVVYALLHTQKDCIDETATDAKDAKESSGDCYLIILCEAGSPAQVRLKFHGADLTKVCKEEPVSIDGGKLRENNRLIMAYDMTLECHESQPKKVSLSLQVGEFEVPVKSDCTLPKTAAK